MRLLRGQPARSLAEHDQMRTIEDGAKHDRPVQRVAQDLYRRIDPGVGSEVQVHPQGQRH